MSTDLVTLADAKTHLNLGTATTFDAQLQGFIDAATPIVENITGPIMQRTVTEWHSGGKGVRDRIVLRQRPVVSITTITEYTGVIANTVTVVTDPQHGGNYTALLEVETGTVQRIVGSGQPYPWSWGEDNIVVVYTAGIAADSTEVPSNVRLGTLELIRHWWQSSQQGGRPKFANSTALEDEMVGTGGLPYAYAVPNRVTELLQPNQRIPGFA